MPSTILNQASKKPVDMNSALLRLSLCLIVLSMATGCYTKLAVNIGNGTSESVWVKSSETGAEVEIVARRFKKVSHSTGDFFFRTQAKEEFKFADISPFHVERKYRSTHRNVFGCGSVTLNICLDTNMHVYVLLPGQRYLTDKTQQPDGYPKTGHKITK